MTADNDYRQVLAAYPAACSGGHVESLGTGGGFSGALFWRIESRLGPLCLRRWPREHPSPERLEFIQAVLWHAAQEGFHRLPLPLETGSRAGYVRQGGHFWQLEPWIAGKADYRTGPTDSKLKAAMAALAEFHRAASSFPLLEAHLSRSPGIIDRLARLDRWTPGELDRLRMAIEAGARDWPELLGSGSRLIHLFPGAAGKVRQSLLEAARLEVPLQACIRDIWHDHVLFEGSRVSGLIDFGAMRAENVAGDVARLLGSLVGDDAAGWQQGLAEYERLRPLSVGEALLVTAFDRGNVLLSGLNWLDWICRQRRVFENHEKAVARLEEVLRRMERLAARVGADPS
jgi:Ser/Thr protein kinase RdoA (MazF antagonist)